YNNMSRYYYNKDKRLTRIIKRDRDKKLLLSERFLWGKKDSYNEGRLMGYILYDEDNSPKLARYYHYDRSGNIKTEILHGRITENSGSLRLENWQPHHESSDKVVTSYTYSDDGLNLKTSECDAAGNYTFYKYFKGTNLLRAKLMCEKE